MLVKIHENTQYLSRNLLEHCENFESIDVKILGFSQTGFKFIFEINDSCHTFQLSFNSFPIILHEYFRSLL